MRRSAAEHEKRASSPELPAGFMSSLLEFDGRPRSWSSNPTQLPRSASIRSSTRGAQSIESQSRPRVATTFSSDARRIEARGQIFSQEARPGSASSMTPSTRRQALSMMKPLAAPNLDPDAGRNTDSESTRVCSKSSSDSSFGEEAGIISSSLPYDLSTLPQSPTARHPKVKARAPATVDTAVAQGGSKAAVSDQGSSLWAAISRLSLGASANGSQSSLESGAGARKSAVDHLKAIERRQPSEHVANSLEADSPAAGSTVEEATSAAEAETEVPAPAEAPVLESASTPANAAAAVGTPRSSNWLGWWSGANKLEAAVDPSRASKPEAEVEQPRASRPETEVERAAAEVVVGDAQPHTHPAGSSGSTKNMLLPEFDIGDEGFAMDLLPRSHVLAGLGSSAGKHACPDGEADGSGPLRKRLRTLGRAAVDLAVDYAPGWARSALQGQRVADTHGQHQGSGDDAAATVDQLKELMDNSARRIGRVAVIGVHGWFPMRMLQMLAGEPTGRSEKFCEMMRDALTEYLRENHGVAVDAGDISLFPLVGEGRIQDRVELLLSQITDTEGPEPAAAADARGAAGAQAVRAAEALMPPRAERAAELQAADTVFVVTHSQGTAVSALLVERLLELGLLEPARQRVAMLAMAGIGHGPLVHLRDNVVIKYIESAAARELFELMDPSSALSQRFVAALSTALHRGVRVVCVGSWVDEVVPLYSAIVQGVSHPGVLRAVYIDAPHYADDFLTALIVFALRLRNAGIYDHGLLVHVSGVVAGSLWGHWGHSTVYGEPAVYKLAVKWLLFSTAAKPQPAPREHMSYRPLNAAEPLNPFFLPWIMRTLWDDPAVQSSRSLRAELQRLAALFDVWTPETKAGRELRYRLEPVRAGP